MTYDENRISDQIDGGLYLKNQAESCMTPVNYNRSLVYLNILERIRKAATGNDAVSRGLRSSDTPAAVIVNNVSMMIQDNRATVVGLLGEDIVQAVEGLKLVHPKTTGL